MSHPNETTQALQTQLLGGCGESCLALAPQLPAAVADSGARLSCPSGFLSQKRAASPKISPLPGEASPLSALPVGPPCPSSRVLGTRPHRALPPPVPWSECSSAATSTALASSRPLLRSLPGGACHDHRVNLQPARPAPPQPAPPSRPAVRSPRHYPTSNLLRTFYICVSCSLFCSQTSSKRTVGTQEISNVFHRFLISFGCDVISLFIRSNSQRAIMEKTESSVHIAAPTRPHRILRLQFTCHRQWHSTWCI